MSRTALLFPGQGAQTLGMGATLVASLDAARELFDHASQILDYDLLKVCVEGPEEKLNSTVFSQPALFVTSLAALEKLKAEKPDVIDACEATAGLSLGEYTALVFAGVMSFEAGLRVVKCRGEVMQAAADDQPSGMLSLLGLELDVIEDLCRQARVDGEVLQVANMLCPGNIVVSGDRAACERIVGLAEAAGAMKVIPLPVAGAFHTPLMQSAVEKFTRALGDVPLNRPRISVISNVNAQPQTDPETIRGLLVDQVVSPVRWEDSMRYLLDNGYDNFYEVGPGRVLRGLLRRIRRKAKCENISA